MKEDAPDRYTEELAKFPERQIGFYKSGFSGLLDAASYCSIDSWLIPRGVEPGRLFQVTRQKYNFTDFIPGRVLTMDGKSFVQSDGLLAYFPMSQYFKSRVCASFALRKDEDAWHDPFLWHEASFTYSPRWEHLRYDQSQSRREDCLVDPSGTLVVVGDRDFWHVLYDVAPLNLVTTKSIHTFVAGVAHELAASVGLSDNLNYDWTKITDEQFEQLCYDVIFMHPKFDADTIRKLGKSRSRDGGRDIEVHDIPSQPGFKPNKWIFQCKLIGNGSSLTATKLVDVGDMLDHYGAQGFGVFTTGLIDATLYDKLDAVCGKRSIEQLHFSSLELERTLIRYPTIRNRYFH